MSIESDRDLLAALEGNKGLISARYMVGGRTWTRNLTDDTGLRDFLRQRVEANTVHEFSGYRSAKGHTSWMRCSCGAVASHNSDGDLHFKAVEDGVSGPGGPDSYMFEADFRPDRPQT